MIRRIAVSTGISLLATVAMAVSVIVDWDRQADFSGFRTYAWAKGTEGPVFLQTRVVEAVEAELQARGYERVESGADIYVVTHAVMDEQALIDVGEVGAAALFSGGGMGTRSVNTSELDVGILVVDIFDADSKELVWRGQASATVTNDKEKRDKRIGKAVAKMFKKFPPKPK
jgi:hypothetical protein